MELKSYVKKLMSDTKGANELGFMEWLIEADVVAMPELMIRQTFVPLRGIPRTDQDERFIAEWRDEFWCDYVADLEYADRVMREDREMEMNR